MAEFFETRSLERIANSLEKQNKVDEPLIEGKEEDKCPLSGLYCDEKKNTCAPDWGGHGEPAFCHLK